MSKDFGVIKAFAVGAKSIKSKRGNATSLLAYSNFHLDKKGDTYKITEASVIKMFFKAGTDIEILSLAQYFCELSVYLCPEAEEETEEFLRLILNSLHFLTEKIKPQRIIKAITELRIAKIIGYSPNLIACNNCGKFEDNQMYFNIASGQLFCEECRINENSETLPLDVLKAMRHIIYSKFENVYSFELSDKLSKRLNEITEKYLVFQTERNYKTLDFYKQIVG